jgi:hypothetical protein
MQKIKNIYHLFSAFLASNMGVQAKYYFYFYIIVWLVHLVVISIISYFHLLLNHNISTIGDWIVDRGWTLIVVSKIFVFILAYQFIKLKTDSVVLLRKYLKNAIQWPRQEMYVCLGFLILGLVSLGQIQWNTSLIFEIDRIFLSMLGTFLFFASDFILLVILNLLFPIHEEFAKIKRIILFSYLFYFFTYITFQYEQVISLKLFAYFFLLLYTAIWRRPNWTFPFIFLVFFIIPAFSLLGLDPVWGHSFTIFKMPKQISTFQVFILIIFATGYLQYRLKNKAEYIYRE